MPNIYNQIKTAFRFYESLDFQAVNSDICEDINQHEWLLMNEVIMPFQIRKDNYAFNIASITLHDVNADTDTDITADLAGGLHTDTNIEIEGEYFDFITYQPDTATYVISPGVYYLTVQDSTGEEWYSEYFEMVCEDLAEEMTKMEQYLSGSGNLIADTGVKLKIQNNII